MNIRPKLKYRARNEPDAWKGRANKRNVRGGSAHPSGNSGKKRQKGVLMPRSLSGRTGSPKTKTHHR